jgi:hypothetical protein
MGNAASVDQLAGPRGPTGPTGPQGPGGLGVEDITVANGKLTLVRTDKTTFGPFDVQGPPGPPGPPGPAGITNFDQLSDKAKDDVVKRALTNNKAKNSERKLEIVCYVVRRRVKV